MSLARIFIWLFVLVGLAELLGLALNWSFLHFAAKPLIMVSLIGYYVNRVIHRSFTFILALLFCWAGDVLLLFQAEMPGYFLFGLVAFLLGHVLYIVAYVKHRWQANQHELIWTQKVRFSFPIVLTGTGLIAVLYPNLASLKIPVIIYSVVLMMMVMTALFRYGRTTSTSFWMAFAGAALFMCSDSLLAINKFYSPLPLGSLWVMTTYLAAQFLIVEGIGRHERPNTGPRT